MFVEKLQEQLKETGNLTRNEKGALAYKSTGNPLVDLNFLTASMRSFSPEEIWEKFQPVYEALPNLTLKWLFFARDIRQGLGERRLFRIIFHRLCQEQPKLVQHLIRYIPEFGRWDDVVQLVNTNAGQEALFQITRQLGEDNQNLKDGKSISLVAKWLPSINTSSKDSVRLAHLIARHLKLREQGYRKMLSTFRKKLDVVEVKMSAKEWDKIEYPNVPSLANLLYRKAFLRHDKERREEYLASLAKGETKINAGVLYPHDIAHRYDPLISVPRRYIWLSAEEEMPNRGSFTVDESLEALWKALPNTVTKDSSTIVVADGSGSMTTSVGSSNISALTVANALAIYFAEKLDGEFKDKYITFSMNPQLVDMSKCSSLAEKLYTAKKHSEVANTDIEAVFKLILDTAIANKSSQDDLPKNILIISDMEFDEGTHGSNLNQPLFKTIEDKFKENGYQLPRLVFWNVNSRSGAIPIKSNSLGVSLVSGFSVNIATMVMSGNLDPWGCLQDILLADRYANITVGS
jgi:hypothetical protein